MADSQSRNPNLPKNADEQIARLRQALVQNAECGTTHYNLAVALIGKQEFVEAEKELHDAIDCSPTMAEAYVQLGGLCLQRGILRAVTGSISGPPRPGPALPKAMQIWVLFCCSWWTVKMPRKMRKKWTRPLKI